ncbi:MAG: NAD-dependent epimerase/dehydratase family protein [Candidatus Aenigmarchaeota archaeon]|nr:NAD-dependent epimerase/dehydratase family protein [Candidatus Aenigmarchaeota archaeon]
MNILITGGAGFIGSHLTEKLLEERHSVTIYDNFMRGIEAERNVKEIISKNGNKNFEVVKGDVTDFKKTKKVIKNKDQVYHLAALPSHRLALKQPRDYAMVDVIGTVNVLEASRLTESTPKVIFASSNKVYGKLKPPFKETMSPKPEGPYGLSKFCSEEFCKMYVDYYGLDVPVIRYHHVIGPRCQPDRELSIFAERALKGKKPIVHGTFENGDFISCAADYTNIHDAVKGTILVSGVEGFDTFNLATGKVTTVLEIAEMTMEKLGKNNLEIEYKEMLPHETLVHRSEVSKIGKKVGFKAKKTVEEAIEDYVKWRLKIGPRDQAVYK